jgi:hypothetical protein
MGVPEILALVSGAQGLLKILVPEIEKIIAKGEVSADELNQLKAAVDSIRDGSAFLSSEWNQPPLK